MFKLAFSTVACPDRTLNGVARAALEAGFEGVDLRTFGPGSAILPCDPALTDPAKVRSLFSQVGVEIASVASSARFDTPLGPPVIGRALGDFEREVREAKHHLDLAHAIGAESVRVFAFEPAPAEKRSNAVKRIVDRLKLLCDHARNRSVMIALENGGGFSTAEQIAELIDAVGSPSLGACYSLAAGVHGHDDPIKAINILGDRLVTARIKDCKKGVPCRLGDGDLPCKEFVQAIRTVARPGWLIFEWDKLWMPELADAETVLAQANQRLVDWLYEPGEPTASTLQPEPIAV